MTFLFFQSLVFVVSFYVIIKGADILVESAVKIATLYSIPPLIIGLTIVAMGTSAPEFAVSVSAALSGSGGLSLGNVVGSNIFNVGVILGIVAIISPIDTNPRVVYRDTLTLVIASAVLLFSIKDGVLEKSEAGTLLVIFVLYLGYLYVGARKEKKKFTELDMNEDLREKVEEISLKKSFLWVVTGLVLLTLGSHYLVLSAVNIAEHFGVSEWLIGITIVAAGTSMPELVTAMTSLYKKQADLGIGSLIGSDIFNVLWVMGSAGLIRNIQIEGAMIGPTGAMLAMVCLLFFLLRHNWKIGRVKGAILILFALSRWAFDLYR